MAPENSDFAPAAAASSTNGNPPTQQSTQTESSQSSGNKEDKQASEAASTEKKLSAAELKKQKKEEKAARRAQAKESQGLPAQSQKPDHPQTGKQPKASGSSASANQGQKGQQAQKRRPSVSASRQLPVRPAKEAAEKSNMKSSKNDSKTVALFAHLYGQRRTTLESASRDVHPAVLALGLKLSSYQICGSTARCVAMLMAFQSVIRDYTTPVGTSLTRHLTSHISSQIEHLVGCRPLATSQGNAIRWLKLEISAIDPDTEEDRAKADLIEGISAFIRDRITAAGQVIADAASAKIEDEGDVVLTFGKSHVVLQALAQAKRKGKHFTVVVVDSRPKFEGKVMAKSLAEIGVEVIYSTTHNISHLVDRGTKVFLGAHSIMGNGRLCARAGTAMLAMMAKAADLPVIVLCEGIKFTDRVALDSIVVNEVLNPDELVDPETKTLANWRSSPGLQILNLAYDYCPAEFISSVISEIGLLPPSSVPVMHRLITNS